jgi:hypothetical protein
VPGFSLLLDVNFQRDFIVLVESHDHRLGGVFEVMTISTILGGWQYEQVRKILVDWSTRLFCQRPSNHN